MRMPNFNLGCKNCVKARLIFVKPVKRVVEIVPEFFAYPWQRACQQPLPARSSFSFGQLAETSAKIISENDFRSNSSQVLPTLYWD